MCHFNDFSPVNNQLPRRCGSCQHEGHGKYYDVKYCKHRPKNVRSPTNFQKKTQNILGFDKRDPSVIAYLFLCQIF